MMVFQQTRLQITRLWRWFAPLQLILITAAIGFTIGVIGAMCVLLLNGDFNLAPQIVLPPPTTSPGVHLNLPPPTRISPLFTPEVQFWADKIMTWSQQSGLDPNLIATVMQIESCGDPQVGSGAGAQGLFQVLPLHFKPGEDVHDPDTNARVGLAYLRGSLIQAGGHVGLALAGYDGGYGVINLGWGQWVTETRLYYTWGTSIYLDAMHGQTSSAALQDWLKAGGVNLCHQSAAYLFPATVVLTATPIAGASTPSG